MKKRYKFYSTNYKDPQIVTLDCDVSIQEINKEIYDPSHSRISALLVIDKKFIKNIFIEDLSTGDQEEIVYTRKQEKYIPNIISKR